MLRGHLHDTEALWLSTPYRQVMEMAVGAAYQGRVQYQNRALLVEVEVAAAAAAQAGAVPRSGRSARAGQAAGAAPVFYDAVVEKPETIATRTETKTVL